MALPTNDYKPTTGENPGITNQLNSDVTNALNTSTLGTMSFGSTSSSVDRIVDSYQSIGGNITNDGTGLLDSLGGVLTGDIPIASFLGNSGESDFTSFASSLSSLAGQANDILSTFRLSNSKNPSGAELFANRQAAITLSPSSQNDWRVRINAPWQLFDSKLFSRLEETGGAVWPYLPNITLSTKANYTTTSVVHSNYPFQAYKDSQVEDISIAGEFSCETETDAVYRIADTTFFRTATKMYFGSGDNVGNPPIICTLSGYGKHIFDNVPVVIKSFSVDFKDSVNYIRCTVDGKVTWVPILSTITVTVSPIYNRTTVRQFNLKEYARGAMVNNGLGYI
jgi:hypothetical protein